MNNDSQVMSVADHLWEIHVRGVLPASLLGELDGLDASVEPATTVLSGRLQDEAALYGVLDRLQSFGLNLIEVRQRPEPLAGPRQQGRPDQS